MDTSAVMENTNSALSSALSFWKQFDLDSRRPALDAQGLEIADNQQISVKSRKALASATKAFRKEEGAAKLKLMPQLLRQYQEEIDRLTKRARFAETGYMSLYQALSEAPDPCHALSSVSQPSGNEDRLLSAKVKRLEAEIADYEAEFANLKNQDITIRRLEDEIELLKAKSHEMAEEAVREREAEIKKEANEASENSIQEDSTASAQINELKSLLSESQTLYEEAQDQLMELRSSLDEKDSLLLAYQSPENTSSDFCSGGGGTSTGEKSSEDDALGKIETLELECERLRTELNKERAALDSTVQQQANRERTRALELQDELKRKQEIMEQMIKAKVELEEEVENERRKSQAEMLDLRKLLTAANSRAEELALECESRPTLEEFHKVKSELSILRTVEFNVTPDDEENSGMNFENSDSPSYSDAERLLFARVRKLEGTASGLRVQLEERDKALAEAMNKLRDVSGQLSLKEEQYQELEKENLQLERMKNRLTNKEHGVGQKASSNIEYPVHTETNTDGSELLQKVLGDESSTIITVQDDHAPSMTHILHEQRDRFRQRMQELEADKDSLSSEVANIRQREARLREDNIKLYEKIRYLESFGSSYSQATHRKHVSQSNNIAFNGSRGKTSISDDSMDVETRYKSAYEEQMNPFNDFNQREKRKRYNGLNAVEKITLNMSQLFLMNKYTRSFIFAYACCLHLMVFFVMWSVTHSRQKCPTQKFFPADSLP